MQRVEIVAGEAHGGMPMVEWDPGFFKRNLGLGMGEANMEDIPHIQQAKTCWIAAGG